MPQVSSALPRRRRSPLMALLAVGTVLALLVPLGANAAKGGQTTTIQILDISDWHAQLDPNSRAWVARRRCRPISRPTGPRIRTPSR